MESDFFVDVNDFDALPFFEEQQQRPLLKKKASQRNRTRTGSTKKKKFTKNYLHKVSTIEIDPGQVPSQLLKKYSRPYLNEKDVVLPVTVEGNDKRIRNLSRGYIKASLGIIPLRELQKIVAYLLVNKMLTRPAENYAMFQVLTDKNHKGGSELLLNELLQEPDDVLENAYSIAWRVGLEDVPKPVKTIERALKERERQKKKIEEHNAKLKNSASLESPKLEIPDLLKDTNDPKYEKVVHFPFTKLPRVTDDFVKQAEYVPINTVEPRGLQANVGLPLNDPAIYIQFPMRSFEGRYDTPTHKVVPLCSTEVSQFIDRTALEKDRNPTLGQYEVIMSEFMKPIRIFCNLKSETVQRWLNRLQVGEELSKPGKLLEEDKASLRELGFNLSSLESLGLDTGPANPVFSKLNTSSET